MYSDDSGPIYWPEEDSHDPDSKKYYEITYRPPSRQNNTAYIRGVSVVLPTTPNGCMYECISGGISSSTEPTWGTIEGGTTEDNDVKWRCKSYSSKLEVGDLITESAWISDSWVTLDNPVLFDSSATATRVSAMTVPAGTTIFTLTNHIKVTRVSSRLEEFEKSIIIPIMEL